MSLLAKPTFSALLTAAVMIAAYFGFAVDITTILVLATPIMIAIGAQGWATVAQIHTEAALKMQVADHAHELTLKAIETKPAQGGFISRGLMAIVAMVAVAICACSWFSSSPTVKTAEGAVVDCTMGELAKLEAVAAAFVPLLISGKLTWKALEDAAVAAGEDVGSCLLADVANAVHAPMKVVEGATPEAPPADLAVQNLKKRLAMSKKIHTAHGDY